MKNAHQRFGRLVYLLRTERASTNIRVHLDAFIGEERRKAHFFRLLAATWKLGQLQPHLATVNCLQ